MPRKYNKFGVAPTEKRIALGRTFGSQAERRYAELLESLWEAGVIRDYVCQPRVWLGVPENVYYPDFLVAPEGGAHYYVDVKGKETAQFKRNKVLWKKYGRARLEIIKETSANKFKTVEVIG